MIYLANPSTPGVREAMTAGDLGCIDTPAQGNKRQDGWTWAADNGCFSEKWAAGKWYGWLDSLDPTGCLFAVVPDVVCDAEATDRRWSRYAPAVKALGFPAAYVTQNGCTGFPADADALFTGGDDEWKLGRDARDLMREAKALGLWCHMGRVNSLRRLKLAATDGYDSVDGTYLAFGPDTNLPKLLRYLRWANEPHLGLEAG